MNERVTQGIEDGDVIVYQRREKQLKLIFRIVNWTLVPLYMLTSFLYAWYPNADSCDDFLVETKWLLHSVFDVFMLILPATTYLGIMFLLRKYHIFEFERT
jgi:hypothetical protein